MEWYFWLSAFGAGLFTANAIPHLTNGISGNRFPTPFSKPRGIGLSSPQLNVIWALINAVIGFVLFRLSGINDNDYAPAVIFFAGFAFMIIMLSKRFTKKHKE